MLVQEIKKFMQELQRLIEAKACVCGDDLQLTSLTHHFSTRHLTEEVTKADFSFLLECFKTRWLSMNDNNNYTAISSEANQLWINLAKVIAPLTNKTYVQILFPTVANMHDFNNGFPLAETADPAHFYLDQNAENLYHKNALVEHLIAHKYQLSTCRGLGKKQLLPLSVSELDRLKKSKYSHTPFMIEEEQFNNFWDFLCKKVLLTLNPSNELPIELLPQLLQLIEQFYMVKQNKEAYSVFKAKMHEFFSLLLRKELDSVNLFYGFRIEFEDKKYYLLDFLILMNRADSFNIDKSLGTLTQLICNTHPAFRFMQQHFMPCYTQENSENPEKSVSSEETTRSTTALEQCKLMLLSLLTIDLEHEKRISLWDHSHKVFAGAEKMYALFRPLIANDQTNDLVLTYEKVYREQIATHSQSTSQSFFWWSNKNEAAEKWYLHVRNASLDKLGIYWHEPELIIHALLRFKTTRVPLIIAIEDFLDKLIRTYVQSSSHFGLLQKQFRVNILFCDFIKNLEEHEKQYLLTILRLYPFAEAQSTFLANCAHHLGNRFYELREENLVVSMRFFPADLQKAKITFIESKQTQISEIINEYKESDQIKKSEKLSTYLHNLTRPILTVEEMDKINSSAEAPDYIGAPR